MTTSSLTATVTDPMCPAAAAADLGAPDAGTVAGTFDPDTEATVRDPQPVRPTSTTSAHPTATRIRMPIRRTHPPLRSTVAGSVACEIPPSSKLCNLCGRRGITAPLVKAADSQLLPRPAAGSPYSWGQSGCRFRWLAAARSKAGSGLDRAATIDDARWIRIEEAQVSKKIL